MFSMDFYLPAINSRSYRCCGRSSCVSVFSVGAAPSPPLRLFGCECRSVWAFSLVFVCVTKEAAHRAALPAGKSRLLSVGGSFCA
ncbi:uncharacterized protein CYBJADRAFT_96185 [Cyberlindnera jadinii NRRL Y-1542]|uniref:Uncharacterized protein n=1 Tax=Cyberlindnera jadinii (strain ATCC 18201 / CBS 1600 / BCRC 20928 / JCM 3617 / NBRC 0987 / NRRL Y-1542) TaxID=983966 RepID=A0A1E4S0Q1_CYBJN|nr:hypothetical protein CYBJADRAFT_96185 [Cyberlindnera jadinii NRRL Y-1542]ODV73066.1 hypothetical protein CYBJADRAFT_96185 [Cyberlindnera jadinii NRRL Y-1542]